MGSSAQWVLELSPGTLKAIGAVELLAAVGLFLPAVFDIAPVLVPLAAMTGSAVRLRGHHASAPWREGHDRRRPDLPRPCRLHRMGPFRPRLQVVPIHLPANGVGYDVTPVPVSLGVRRWCACTRTPSPSRLFGRRGGAGAPPPTAPPSAPWPGLPPTSGPVPM
ncbi:DoxX family protein [Streptomyces sp. NPDC048523]|uniref:DoxX family protein n=1 Tax=Streptomyces sp. NPDC048523 TaxID=3365567 RepID=UPI003716DC69